MFWPLKSHFTSTKTNGKTWWSDVQRQSWCLYLCAIFYPAAKPENRDSRNVELHVCLSDERRRRLHFDALLHANLRAYISWILHFLPPQPNRKNFLHRQIWSNCGFLFKASYHCKTISHFFDNFPLANEMFDDNKFLFTYYTFTEGPLRDLL